jgi:hypothetical protein
MSLAECARPAGAGQAGDRFAIGSPRGFLSRMIVSSYSSDKLSLIQNVTDDVGSARALVVVG